MNNEVSAYLSSVHLNKNKYSFQQRIQQHFGGATTAVIKFRVNQLNIRMFYVTHI